MKLSSLTRVVVSAVALTVVLPGVALAGPRKAHQQSRLLDQNDEERYVMVTGSMVPQKVKVRSIGTTTPYNVRIFTHDELQSTGRSTAGEALAALDPSIQISHGR